MGTRRVVARNWATQSDNRIHDDEVARRLGFRGGLVPGVTLFAYLVPAVVEDQGQAWLGGGFIDVRFASPVYDGTAVVAACVGGVVTLRDADGAACVAGSAWLAPPGAADPMPPLVPLPAKRPAASADSLAVGTTLGSVEREADADVQDRYLLAIGEDPAGWREQGIAHPGWLLLDANEVLVRNVELGPWIHGGSRVRLLSTVPLGAGLETRAVVADEYERKGHHMVELHVVMLADGVAAMQVRHTAIWKLRGEGQPPNAPA